MAERKHPVTTASRKRGSDRTRRFPHLKPLSDYSHMVFCKATNSCSVSPSWSPDGPSWNLKVELSNSRASVGRKRRLDDSCLDETHDTPPKKPCFAPDSAWDLDSSNTFRLVKLVSPQSSSVEEIKRIEKTLSDQKPLGLDWIDGSDKTDSESSTSLTAVHSSSPLFVHSIDGADVSLFDYDVGEIMCLSPIDSADVSAVGLENFLQSCETYDEEQLQVKKGHDSWRGSMQKQGTAVRPLGKDSQTGSDEGYITKLNCTADPGESEVTTESEFSKCEQICFMKSYKITVPNLSNDKTSPVFVPNMFTPLAKSPNLYLDKETCNNCEPVKTSSTSSPSACVNLDAGNTEALPTILFLNVNESKEGNVVLEGTSIHKSLVCHDQVKHVVTQGKEDEDVLSVSQRQADSKIRQFGKEAVASDSVKRALPLQVQVFHTYKSHHVRPVMFNTFFIVMLKIVIKPCRLNF